MRNGQWTCDAKWRGIFPPHGMTMVRWSSGHQVDPVKQDVPGVVPVYINVIRYDVYIYNLI